MANHKRKKSKRNVRCTMCTQDRWKGNASERFKEKEAETRKRLDKETRLRVTK
jgi:hypothetical protein